jgi:hypothetical protein
MGLFNPHVEDPKGARLVSRSLGPDPEHADGRTLVIEDAEKELAVCWHSLRKKCSRLLTGNPPSSFWPFS